VESTAETPSPQKGMQKRHGKRGCTNNAFNVTKDERVGNLPEIPWRIPANGVKPSQFFYKLILRSVGRYTKPQKNPLNF
jgi:hypothetical protein